MSRSIHQCSIECFFILFSPSIVIVNIASKIWRVTIDNITFLRHVNSIEEVLVQKLPVSLVDNFLCTCNLVTYLRYIGRSKTVWLLTEWNIPFSFFVKAHHSIESCTRQKYKIKWTVFTVKTVLYLTIICVAVFIGSFKYFAFMLQIGTHIELSNTTVFDSIIKIYQMWVCISYNMITFNWSVQTYNTCSEEWFYPSRIFEINSRLKNKIVNPRYEFSLNTLRFDWWNYNFSHSLFDFV